MVNIIQRVYWMKMVCFLLICQLLKGNKYVLKRCRCPLVNGLVISVDDLTFSFKHHDKERKAVCPFQSFLLLLF